MVPGDGPALFGMPDIVLLGILKITCEVTDSQQTGNKFDSQIMQPIGIPKCKAHMAEDHRADSRNTNHSNVNSLDYFRSSANIWADKKASSIIMQRIHNEFSYVFTGIGYFEGTFKLSVKEGRCPYHAPSRRWHMH